MAKTSDYMDYLDSEIGIAPANSQEEFQAAESIVEIMRDHDLEPTIQEFDAHPVGSLLPHVLAVVMFVGVLLSGVGSTGIRLLGLLLALVPAILLLMRHLGHDVLSEVGSASRSQNVIAVHRATGDKVTKGNRPIVIVAHYDTPRESPLFERLAPYQATLSRLSTPCVIVACVAALLQLFGFLPGVLRAILWVVGIVAMVPALVLAFATFVEKASPCTLGANDNKSSVAALLGLLDQVRPMDDRVSATSGATEASAAGDDEEETPQHASGSAVYGTRHGKEVLEGLGILPNTCEIVYEMPANEEEPSQGTASDDGPAVVGGTDVPVQDGEEYYDDAEGEPYPDETVGADDGEQDLPVDEGNQYDADAYQPDSAFDETDQVEPEDGDSYDEGSYAEEPSDMAEEEAWSDDDSSWTSDDSDDARQGSDGASVGGIRRFFSSLKERFSKSREDLDVSIPRGASNDGVDYSEFEETDWGGDSWDDDQQEPQEELKSISREDLIARRGDARDQEGSEESPSYYEDDQDEAERSDQGNEGPDSEPWDEQQYLDDYDENGPDSPAVADDSQGDEPTPESEAPSEQEPVAEGRTSHDISHDNGPDWAIVEEQEESNPGDGAEGNVNPVVYEQVGESSDNEYGLESMDLVEVEEELEEDQVASAPIRERKTPHEGGDVEKTDAQTSPVVSAADDTREPEPEDAPELDWDEGDDQDATGDDDDVLPKDSRGLDTMSEEFDAYESDEDDYDAALDEPDPIDDPTWGETSYVPPRRQTNVARRATLYDVPNPSEDTSDPLADDSDDEGPDERADKPNGEGRSDSSRASKWKGGAAIRSDLQEQQNDTQAQSYEDLPEEADFGNEQGDGELAPIDENADGGQSAQEGDISQDDLQDAILRMGDDLLVSHDIWFVAVGASSVNHAGIRAFLSDFRQDIRGAFLINLDSIGAGELSILTSEGLDNGRRSDRRLVRLMTNVADDLHLPLAKRSHDWGDTDATPAMRSRVRAVTLMGVDQNGLPALSHTEDDVPQNVDPRQVSSVVRLIAEAIRRS